MSSPLSSGSSSDDGWVLVEEQEVAREAEPEPENTHRFYHNKINADPLKCSANVFFGAFGLKKVGGLTGRDRCERAFSIGRHHALYLRQEDIEWPKYDYIPLDNRVYVILVSQYEDGPGLTKSAKQYYVHLHGEEKKRTIGFGFPSQTEARAYCIGAGLADIVDWYATHLH